MKSSHTRYLCLFLSVCVVLPLTPTVFPASKDPVRGRKGMVVSADEFASRVGIEILKKGGNAVDAAVAVGFTLAVTFPQAGNIGGGGFMVIRMADGRTTTIDYREKAPAAAHRDMYLDEAGNFVSAKSEMGHLSAGVPGSVAGLLYALEKYGTRRREQVMQPAIDFAERGFPVSYRLAGSLKEDLEKLSMFPATKKIFTKNGTAYEEGDILVQRDLAETLKRIQRLGRDGFYKGRTADLIVREMQRGGGLITHADLESYQPVERPPILGSYRGYEIVSIGPPSSGGIALVQLLNLLEGFDLRATGFGSSKTIALMAEAMKLVYADRAQYLGDSDFYPVPIEKLISKEYAAERRRLIDTVKATPSSQVAHGSVEIREGSETTHYSIVDRWGNAVSVTTTINSWFGSFVVVEGAGFLLNNEMDDFSAKPGVPNQYGLLGGEANAIEPGKRMLSAMTPTIVLKDQKPFLLVGSPGGSTIITTVLQVITNVIDFGMHIQEAIDAPRIHHQWYPDTLMYEKRGMVVDVLENLKRRGYALRERDGYQGRAEGIVIDAERGLYLGATDPRGYGSAIGY
ncbi:MAG TPA: gamma-glutamyltransferase [Bacteroidota bacterium]|nr:gamma-glutamyltransferase [Bacteroidota bacterium]